MDLRPILLQNGLELEGVPTATPNGLIAHVRRDDQALVLKVAKPGRSVHWRALQYYDGRGCVRLVDRLADDAILLERLTPGHSLGELGEDEALAAYCSVVRPLHSCGLLSRGFGTIESSLARTDHLPSGDIPPAFIDRAIKLRSELLASQGPGRLLHADLHHDNIIFDEQRGWLAIDPHGVIGESEFEVAALLRNPSHLPPWHVTPEVVRRRVDHVSKELGLDPQRILGWIFVESAHLAKWAISHRIDPACFLAVAQCVTEQRKNCRNERRYQPMGHRHTMSPLQALSHAADHVSTTKAAATGGIGSAIAIAAATDPGMIEPWLRIATLGVGLLTGIGSGWLVALKYYDRWRGKRE